MVFSSIHLAQRVQLSLKFGPPIQHIFHARSEDRMATLEPVDPSNGPNVPSEFNDRWSDNDDPYSDEYDSNDDDEDSDLSDFSNGVWRFIKTPVDAPISFQLDSADKLLLKTLKEETRVISGRILSMIDPSKNLLNEIVNLFLSPLISAWTDTANVSNAIDVPPLQAKAIHHFI